MIEWTMTTIIAISLGVFGWSIAIMCIIRKHDWAGGRYSCLAGDLVTATFSTITVVAVINLSFVMYVDFRDIEEANSKLQNKLLETKEHESILQSNIVSLMQDNRNLSRGREELMFEIESLRSIVQNPTTIVQELTSSMKRSNVSHEELAKDIIIKHFGNITKISRMEFSFEITRIGEIKCYLEGDFNSGLFCEKL